MAHHRRSGIFLGFALAAILGAAPSEAASVRYQADLHGNFVLVGNTLGHDCSNGTPAPVVGTVGACGSSISDSAPDVFWRSDAPGAGAALADTGIAMIDARSTAVLALPAGATVKYARLYWSALSTTAQADTSVLFERPGAFTGTVSADFTPHTVPYNSQAFYESGADVTAIVTQYGNGPYRVGDVLSTPIVNVNDSRPYVSWSLIVLYETGTDPLRQLTVFDGLDQANTGSGIAVNISGFLVPNSGIDAKLGIVAYGTDGQTGGDTLSFNGTLLSDGLGGTNNFFNGSRTVLGTAVSTPGDLPQLTGGIRSMPGVDMDVVDVTTLAAPGSTSASISVKAGSDGNVMAGLVVTSITTFKPNFDGSIKKATDVNGGSVLAGDVIRYTIDVNNTGNDPGVGVVLKDVVPTGVTFVPGSIQVVSGPNSGTKTDATGDDQGEYDAATHTVTIRLGTGANATTGGTLGIGTTSTVSFDVTVGTGAVGTISNQASILASGLNGAPVATYSSSSATGTPTTDIVVDECRVDLDCPAARPHCLTSAVSTLPNVCVKCITSSDCSGTSPVCDATHNCVPCTSDAQCTNPTAPACQPPGSALAGACTECTTGNPSLCGGATPICLSSLGVCGCTTDSNCGGPTSGVICTGPTGVCAPGCSTAPGRNDCPSTSVCSKQDGTVGTCSPQVCTTDGDCSAPTPHCDTAPVTHVCVQCLNDGQCPTGQVCDPANKTCVQCTPTSGTCSPGGSGGACLTGGVCGCNTDSDCGGATSGRVCDATAKICIPGCRGTSGNGCPTSLVCTSTNATIGTCVPCTSDAQCGTPTPRCSGSNVCVQCLTFADCPSTAPVCSGGVCVGCTGDGDCKDATKPACNTASGPLQGSCTECTTSHLTLCGATKPQCLTAGVCGCSDTDGDSECGGPTSGIICNGPAGSCVPGCSLAALRNDCPANQYCDDRTGGIGQCLSQCVQNSDCTAAPNLVCNTAPIPHVCVECVKTSDCGAGKVCDVAQNKCVGCVTSADCALPTPICNGSTQTCVQCVQTANCLPGQVCDPGTLTCVGCVTSQDCTAPQVCDPGTLTCVGCVSNADCPPPSVCDTTAHSCVGCTKNADCTPPDVCDTAAHTCVRCVTDSDCSAPTPACDTGKHLCVPCTKNADCATASQPVCDTTAEVCVGCTKNADCTAPGAPVCNVPTKTCVGCSTSTDCTAPMVCDPTKLTCVGCTPTAGCTAPDVCDPGTQTCVGCLTDTDCQAGQTCNPATHVCASKPSANVVEGGGCACSVPGKTGADSPLSLLAGLGLAAVAGVRRRGRRSHRG